MDNSELDKFQEWFHGNYLPYLRTVQGTSLEIASRNAAIIDDAINTYKQWRCHAVASSEGSTL